MTSLLLKEWREAARNYKILIIGFALLFFAFLDPLAMKFLPEILKSQTGMEGISELMVLDQREAVRSFLGDVTTIIPVIMAFTIGGTLTREFSEHYLDMPMSKGLDLNRLLTAKWVFYSGFTVVATTVAVLVNYVYAGLIFEDKTLVIAVAFRALMMLSAILVYYVAVLLLVETVVRKAYLASVISLGLFFGQYAMMLLVSPRYRYLLPHFLMSESASMAATIRTEDWTCLALTGLYSLILLFVGRMAIDRKQVF